MKKTDKTKLRIASEILRTLHAHELHQLHGGNAVPTKSIIEECPPPPLTQDSARACCA
jgi:hypothetical protein